MPAVRVAVVSQDEKGASILSLMDEHLDEVKEPMPGRVATQELQLFRADTVQPGDVLVGYGLPASDRLDVSWHPFGRQALIESCQSLLVALRAPDAYGVLPVGFKSPPADVEAAVGTTRTQFKIAAARLFREGAIEPLRAHEMRLARDAPWPEALPKCDEATGVSSSGALECEVFFRGLPEGTSALDVLGWCTPFGTVRCVRAVVVATDGMSSGEIIGQTWVRFERAEEAAAALAATERRDAAEKEPVPERDGFSPAALPAAVEALPASSEASRTARGVQGGQGATDAPPVAASGPTRAEKRHARESAARREERRSGEAAVQRDREERRYNRLYDRQERRYGSSASAPPRREWKNAVAVPPSTRVLVSSLPDSADRTEELELELRRTFFDCGKVREVHWPSRRQWQLGVRHCVLEFFDEAAAAKAVRNSRHTNQRLLGGVPLDVSMEEPSKLTRYL